MESDSGTPSAPAAAAWAADLAAWAIPEEILAGAPESPWIHPPELFEVDGPVPDSPSHRRAREALPQGGSVLDVGCGGGRAAMALAGVAASVTGVDHQQAMLDRFAAAAEAAGLRHAELLGDWPDADAVAPDADVVVCHHVVYNVRDLPPFLLALGRHARRRTVLELPWTHPLTHMSGLWLHFWGLERPSRPTAEDALSVALEAGLPARLDVWEDEPFTARSRQPLEQQAHHQRIRLCLPAEREAEVLDYLRAAPPEPPRRMATLWWEA